MQNDAMAGSNHQLRGHHPQPIGGARDEDVSHEG
jgi:hypothetical protein